MRTVTKFAGLTLEHSMGDLEVSWGSGPARTLAEAGAATRVCRFENVQSHCLGLGSGADSFQETDASRARWEEPRLAAHNCTPV